MKLKLIIAACVVSMLVACTGTKTLYSLPDTPVEYVKAVMIHHNALGEQVVMLRNDPTVSADAKNQLLLGYRRTVCDEEESGPVSECQFGPVYQLDRAAKAYEGLRNAQNEQQMQAALTEVVTLLTDLIAMVRGAK